MVESIDIYKALGLPTCLRIEHCRCSRALRMASGESERFFFRFTLRQMPHTDESHADDRKMGADALWRPVKNEPHL